MKPGLHSDGKWRLKDGARKFKVQQVQPWPVPRSHSFQPFLRRKKNKTLTSRLFTSPPLLGSTRNLEQCCNILRRNQKCVSLPHTLFQCCWNLGSKATFLTFLFCVVVTSVSLSPHPDAFAPDVYTHDSN